MTTQLWALVQPPVRVGSMSRRARQFESDGWDGILIPDSQCLAPDPIVAMTLAAAATTKLGIGSGVTNPVTRHPAALAGAVASIAALAPGRVTVGIGRGDSSLAYLGQGPSTTEHLRRYVAVLRTYLAHQEVTFDRLEPFLGTAAQAIETIHLADSPNASRLQWLGSGGADVPVEVAASGPRAIRLAAREADGVLLALGADPDRLRWGVDLARDSGPARVSAFVNVVCLDDSTLARTLGRTMLSAFARFSAMDGRVRAPMDDASRDQLTRLHGSYNMREHGGASGAGAAHAETLTDDFVDRFGIFGPADYCIERLSAIAELGVDRIIIVGPTSHERPEAVAEARRRMTEEILPTVREIESGGSSMPSSLRGNPAKAD